MNKIRSPNTPVTQYTVTDKSNEKISTVLVVKSNDKTTQPENRQVSMATYKEFADLYDNVVAEVMGHTESRLKTLGCANCDKDNLHKAADFAIEASISRQLKFVLKCPSCNLAHSAVNGHTRKCTGRIQGNWILHRAYNSYFKYLATFEGAAKASLQKVSRKLKSLPVMTREFHYKLLVEQAAGNLVKLDQFL